MNFKDFNNADTFMMSNDERINFSIANSKMTDEEWTNFNNYMNHKEYDEQLLINTFIDFVIVTASCQSDKIGAKPEFTMHLHNFSENRLLHHSGDLIVEKMIKEMDTVSDEDMNKINDIASEKCRLPKTITELVKWTEEIYREDLGLKDTPTVPVFHIYMNQNNDKFMCLIRLWEMLRWTYNS